MHKIKEIEEIKNKTLNQGKNPSYQEVCRMADLESAEVDYLLDLVIEMDSVIKLYRRNGVRDEDEVQRLLDRVDWKINKLSEK